MKTVAVFPVCNVPRVVKRVRVLLSLASRNQLMPLTGWTKYSWFKLDLSGSVFCIKWARQEYKLSSIETAYFRNLTLKSMNFRHKCHCFNFSAWFTWNFWQIEKYQNRVYFESTWFQVFCFYFDSALNFQWFLRELQILVIFCENVIFRNYSWWSESIFFHKVKPQKSKHVLRRWKQIKSNSGKLRLLPFRQRLSLEQKERIFFHGLQHLKYTKGLSFRNNRRFCYETRYFQLHFSHY